MADFYFQMIVNLAPLGRPPDYSIRAGVSTKEMLAPIHREGKDRVFQLRKYLIDILAFTFEANPQQLNFMFAALERELPPFSRRAVTADPTRRTILDGDEKDDLMMLATLAERLRQWIVANLFMTIPREHKDIIQERIIFPAQEIGMPRTYGFAIDLIASYANHQCDPTKRSYNLLASRWMPNTQVPYSPLRYTQLCAALESHHMVMSVVSPMTPVHWHLNNGYLLFWERLATDLGPFLQPTYDPRNQGIIGNSAGLLREGMVDLVHVLLHA